MDRSLGTEIDHLAYDAAEKQTYAIQVPAEGEPVPEPVTCFTDAGAVAGSFVVPKKDYSESVATLSLGDGAYVVNTSGFFELTPTGLAKADPFPKDMPGLVLDVLPELGSVLILGEDKASVTIDPLAKPGPSRTIDVGGAPTAR